MAEKAKNFIGEFKEFAVKGNVIDLAVGVIIGGAFSKIISSLVNDVITPPLGLILGRVDLSNRFIALSTRHFDSFAQAKAARVPTINYGAFINNIIEFLLIALVIFIAVKQINKFKREPAPSEKDCPFCSTKIPLAAKRCPNCTSQLN